MRHRKTDPACTMHSEPITPLAWWWYNRQRGKSCPTCMEARQTRANRKAFLSEMAAIRNENGGW